MQIKRLEECIGCDIRSAISNRAVDEGTVDACADLLMFLTAPKQNNRLIGDLKGGIVHG